MKNLDPMQVDLKEDIFLENQIINKELLQLSVYHSFQTNKKKFENLNLKLDNELKQKISSIDLLSKIAKILSSKIENNNIANKFRNYNYYKIKENIQKKIPKVILQTISNFIGSLTNVAFNNKNNTLLDLTKYESLEYNFIQKLGGLHSSTFAEKKINEMYGNRQIDTNLLKKISYEGNIFGIYLILSHPNIQKILVNHNNYIYDFNNPIKLKNIIYKNWGPRFSKNGLHMYYYCKHCNNNFWKDLGKGNFNIVILVEDGFLCNFCRVQIMGLKNIRVLAMDCDYFISLKKAIIDLNSPPYITTSNTKIEKKESILKNEIKFIVLSTLGTVSYFSINVY